MVEFLLKIRKASFTSFATQRHHRHFQSLGCFLWIPTSSSRQKRNNYKSGASTQEPVALTSPFFPEWQPHTCKGPICSPAQALRRMLVPETSAHLFSQPSAKRKKNGLLTPADTALEPGKSKEASLSSECRVFFLQRSWPIAFPFSGAGWWMWLTDKKYHHWVMCFRGKPCKWTHLITSEHRLA